ISPKTLVARRCYATRMVRNHRAPGMSTCVASAGRMIQAAQSRTSCNDAAMIVERGMSERFLSNTYLVADGEGGAGFFVDAGGPVGPLIEAAKRRGVEPTHVLLTHHHFDHVSEVGALCKRWPKLEVLIHPLEREGLAELGDSVNK